MIGMKIDDVDGEEPMSAWTVRPAAFGIGVWKTRDGRRVDITRDVGSQYAFNLQGRVDSGIKMESWAADGTPMRDVSEPHLRLVGPWVNWKSAEIEPWATETQQETSEVEANDAIKVQALTAQLQVADRKSVHLEGELVSMAVLLRDAVKEGEEHKRTAKDRTAELLAADQRVAAIDKEMSDAKADRCWFKNLSQEQEQTIESMKKESEEQQGKIKSQQQTIDAQFQTIDQTIVSWRQVAREKDDEIERLRESLGSEMDSNIEETGRLKNLIAGIEEENVLQGYKLSAALDERDTEKLKAKLELDALTVATEKQQDDTLLPAIRRFKVRMLVCRAVTVLLLAAIPLAGQWIAQNGPGWMVDSSGRGILGPGTLFAAFIAWLGICIIGATIEGEIRRAIELKETEYLRLRNKVAPERRQDW